MTYATAADLDERYGAELITRLSDKDNTGERQQATIDGALSDADVLIDSHLDGRYTLPLTVVPRLLQIIALKIARYNLEETCATDRAIADYKDATKLLEKVGSGDISIGLSQDDKRPDGGLVVDMESGGRVWGRDKSKGFI
ncbi:DUF1320 domain-containing protein [Salmonella enterica]|uniref:gp436 family protein n=1 Tax=Salmonella enterica TaxID=28901 RepID=UPI0009B1AADD|nr:phage protein Gp36 family protein [Salmonella enterica]EBG8070655.1 DUF1320 domain-containing protein [Salmonella enterica subsp. enterica serovar Elisabethville]EED8015234.1 DUF1320 domain-containing protein [Salmonella enterica subsp. enterica]EEH1521398.1 DUF1320 domain-containing protein [Salmonella enterica subsp. enterica serovar Telelkebir]EAA8605612.1 DUF1320 domain-containing protein [Salmonella enterica]EBH3514516.1 DUF1320 domain-containing protein [Salmonella enterica subsp. ent